MGYIECLHSHPHSFYFHEKLEAVEESVSVVSGAWREVISLVKDKRKVNNNLVKQVLFIGLKKFVKVLNPENPAELPFVGLGFLNKLHNLLEYFVKLSAVQHNPLVWRLHTMSPGKILKRRKMKILNPNMKRYLVLLSI